VAAVGRAVFGYVADKTGRQAASLKTADVWRFVEGLGLPEAAERLAEILAFCDQERFGRGDRGSQSASPTAGSDLLQEVEKFLVELENRVTKVTSRGQVPLGRQGSKRGPAVGVILLFLVWVGLGGSPVFAQDISGKPAVPVLGLDPVRLMAEGNQAYTGGEIDTALVRYQRVRAMGINDPVLHYNLGNSYARAGQLGRAIHSYLRTLRLDPRNRDARSNLAWVRSHTRDQELETGSMPPVVGYLVRAVHLISLDELSLVLVIFVWLVCLLIGWIWYRGVFSDALRRVLLAVGGVTLLLAVLVGLRFYEEQVRDLAVVVAQEVEVRSGPAESFPIVFRIHDGLTLSLRGQREGWLRIGLGGEWIGWVPEGTVERVRLETS
jgi:hypothetical protein